MGLTTSAVIAALHAAAVSATSAAQAPTSPPPRAERPSAGTAFDAQAVQSRMAQLYDDVCLKTFPIDAAVDRRLQALGATPMSAADVKVTLLDDPGRGWWIEDGSRKITVFLELPPFHACSVRRMTDAGFDDLAPYRAVADAYERSHDGFTPTKPFADQQGAIHIHAIGEQRRLPGGMIESLFVFDQHVSDAARRAKGETAVSERFVHQLMSP